MGKTRMELLGLDRYIGGGAVKPGDGERRMALIESAWEAFVAEHGYKTNLADLYEWLREEPVERSC